MTEIAIATRASDAAPRYGVADGEVIISRTDTRGVIRYVNEALVASSGYAREQCIGRPHSLVRHPDMPAEVFADLRAIAVSLAGIPAALAFGVWSSSQLGSPILGAVKTALRVAGGDPGATFPRRGDAELMKLFRMLEQMNQAVTQMDDVTQQNAALVEEVAAATQSLAGQTRVVVEAMLAFQSDAEEGRGDAQTRRRGTATPAAAAVADDERLCA
jgi:hypothetical protein